MNMFHLLPAASVKLIEPLITLTVKTERALVLEIGSPFRKPLIDFLLHYPQATVEFFLANIADSLINRLFIAMLKREETKPLRTALETNSAKLVNSTFAVSIPQSQVKILFELFPHLTHFRPMFHLCGNQVVGFY